MCKQIKQILFPLNIFGKKKKSVAFNTEDIPVDPYTHFREINIKWTGEALLACYTNVHSRRTGVNRGTTTYTPIKVNYTDGDLSEEQINLLYYFRIGESYYVQDNMVFFNCTNVSYLEINGTRYI